jgi:hypothetical protein
MAIILMLVILMILIDVVAVRLGKDSTDGREGYDWEQQHHGQDNFSARHHAFSSL